MFAGGYSNTTGACPGCGRSVTRNHEWNGVELRDVYACRHCGTYRYGTEPEVPIGRLPLPVSASLTTLLGPENVVA